MADLPRPHRKKAPSGESYHPYDELRREDAIRKAKAEKASKAADTPKGKARFSADTAALNISPELYDTEESSDYGVPDGYDPYEQPYPRRRRSAPQSEYRPPRATYYDDVPRRSSGGSKKRKRRPRRRRRSFFGRFVRGILAFCVSVFAVYSLCALAVISKIERMPDAPRTVTTGMIGNANYTRTVLLIGTDSRDLSQERGRSDSMILLTINDATHEMYMSSLMRDAYVEIPNRGFDKLNAAYSYGGAELLMDTIEQNFDVSVDDYVCVSFTGFAGVIDAFGGVEITLSDAEAEAVNVILQSEVNELMGDDPMADFLPSGGTYVLTGKQALSYARVRYVGNADFERTSRQREVMSQLMQNAKRRAAQAVPKLMSSALPQISTNMTTGELYLLSLRAPVAVWYDIRQQQIPADGTWSAADIGGVSVLQIDTAANQALLRDTAYAANQAPEE